MYLGKLGLVLQTSLVPSLKMSQALRAELQAIVCVLNSITEKTQSKNKLWFDEKNSKKCCKMHMFTLKDLVQRWSVIDIIDDGSDEQFVFLMHWTQKNCFCHVQVYTVNWKPLSILIFIFSTTGSLGCSFTDLKAPSKILSGSSWSMMDLLHFFNLGILHFAMWKS